MKNSSAGTASSSTKRLIPAGAACPTTPRRPRTKPAAITAKIGRIALVSASITPGAPPARASRLLAAGEEGEPLEEMHVLLVLQERAVQTGQRLGRSEERRVGKECV